MVLNKLIKYYKIIKKNFNNRNKLFIFNYQKILILLLKIRFKL